MDINQRNGWLVGCDGSADPSYTECHGGPATRIVKYNLTSSSSSVSVTFISLGECQTAAIANVQWKRLLLDAEKNIVACMS